MSISWRAIFPDSKYARHYSTNQYQDDWFNRSYIDSRKPNKQKRRKKARLIKHAKEKNGW